MRRGESILPWCRPWVLVGAMVAATMLLAAGGAHAVPVTRYAEPSGNGPEPCAQSDPCAINTAIGGASDGDEVVVLPGTYTVAGTISVNDAITVHGAAGQARPQIVSSAPTTALGVGHPGAVVSDLEVQHSGSAAALFVAGTAERIVAHASAASAIGCRVDGGALVRDTICWSSGNNGFGVFESTSGLDSSSSSLRNVTAVASGSNSRGIFADASGGATSALNAKNVIASGVLDVEAKADSNMSTHAVVTLRRSNYDTENEIGPPRAMVTNPGAGTNQTAHPVFLNAAAGDFHQAPGSKTIDHGRADARLGSADIDGDPRTLGPAPDIGADEFIRYRPDGLIKLSGGFSGNGVYNNTGARQTESAKVRRGHSKTFGLKFQNDGYVDDSFEIEGPGSSHGFKLKYLHGQSNVTGEVVAGTYSTPSLAPGESDALKLKVAVTRQAKEGASKSALVKATSDGKPSAKDAVKARVKVP